MAGQRVSRVVCTDGNGVLVGVISLADIARRDEPVRVGGTLRAAMEDPVRL
jgi:hypothetical protein